jgi:hypothetical protein
VLIHHPPTLLQLSLPEGQYRSALPELQARLAAAGARGVYEERLPPELNAALQVWNAFCVIAWIFARDAVYGG